MIHHLKTCVQRLHPAAIAFAVIPVLLYLPALRYSLEAPFALVDDYILWKFLHVFDWFPHWLYIEFLTFDYSNNRLDVEFLGGDWENLRYRPFWELYNAASWKIFGPNSWLHYLARWAANFGAVAAFAAAFLCFERRNPNVDGITARRIIRLLPLTALVYLWLFFPNQPAARLGPPEVYTALFLGLCAWMIALTLARQGKPQTRRAALLTYAAFCIGFCGVAWSKEFNIAPALWLLISYYALTLIEALRRQSGPRVSPLRALKAVSVWKALGGLPLIAVFAHTLLKLYFLSQTDGYGRAPLTPELLIGNAAWIAEGLFQLRTSLLVSVGLALLSSALLLFVAVNIAKKRFSAELVFVIFLLGMFASSYLILCVSWAQVMRYWHILIPPFTALLAFSIKFILQFAADLGQKKRAATSDFARAFTHPQNLAAYALITFIAFFVCCNYYNFLYQTAIRHASRHNEANLIAEITRLHDQGQYIRLADMRYIYLHELATYFHEFLPRFYGGEYNLRSEPPQDAGRPRYTVRYIQIGHLEPASHLPKIAETYRPLAYAYRVADLLQSGDPYRIRDLGVNTALWQIYDSEFNRIWWNGDVLNIRQLIADAGSPIIRSDFDVYLSDDRLIYTSDRCGAADVDKPFFLGVFPVDNRDLPEARRPHGFHNLDFDFADFGFSGGEMCFAVRDLPEYPIKRIHTGQFIIAEDGFHHAWEAEAVLSNE